LNIILSKLSKLIFLKYNEKGEPKTGIIKIKFNYNTGADRLDYSGIDYGDNNIQAFVERNPYVLNKIDFQMNGQLTH